MAQGADGPWVPRMPTNGETALEIPFRLFISPGPNSRFAASRLPDDHAAVVGPPTVPFQRPEQPLGGSRGQSQAKPCARGKGRGPDKPPSSPLQDARNTAPLGTYGTRRSRAAYRWFHGACRLASRTFPKSWHRPSASCCRRARSSPDFQRRSEPRLLAPLTPARMASFNSPVNLYGRARGLPPESRPCRV